MGPHHHDDPDNPFNSEEWRPFHDEIFGNRKTADPGSPTPPLIDRIDWHPYLASHLLIGLVKQLYKRKSPLSGEVYGELYFEGEDMTKDDFAYIVERLPYVQPTAYNLDALRAIVYLLPTTDLGWDIPRDFWFLFQEFLKKYDSSILSPEELEIFEVWLDNVPCHVEHYAVEATD